MKTIYKKLLLLLVILPFSVLAQSSLKGIVTDKTTKQPLPGVNVVIQGSNTGTQTDFDGKFQLQKVNVGDKILISFLGYKNQIINFNSQKEVSISLEEESNQLQEVVVQVGYGSVKKKDATGSIELVTSKEFNKGAIVSADQLLAGKAAGVRITNDGGSPDSAPNIRIRGGASLNASNSPLIIIDGVPISDLGTAGVSNPLNLINPNDIESFSILKDASATAIYGVRASNGVILITTKKGTVGKTQFTFSSNLSIGTLGKTLDVMDGNEFTRFIKQYHPTEVDKLGIPSNVNATGKLATETVAGRTIYNTNWQDATFRTSFSSDNNFSVKANLFNKIPFRTSIGYHRTEGLLRTNDYERYSYSLKLTPKLLNDNLKIDINAKGIYSDKNSVDQDTALGAALSMDPTKPIYGDSFNNKFVGYYQATRPNLNQDQKIGATNPLATLQQRTRPEQVIRILSNIELDYSLPFVKGLRAVVNAGIDATKSKIREYFSDNALNAYAFNQLDTNPSTNYLFNPGLSDAENQTSTNTTLESYLAYSKILNKFITKFDVQGGYSYQNFKIDGNKQKFRNNASSGIREDDINPLNPNNRYYGPLNLQAFFGRANIDLKNKYLFTATIRADATSLYTPENRWGYFPSFGFAWKLKEETFLKNVETIENIKIRLGWGKTGNASVGVSTVGYFPSQLLFEPGNQNSQYLSGEIVYSPKNYNPDLTWEKTTTTNIGIDFEFFKNSILSGSIDAYKRKTNDLIASVPFEAGGTATGLFVKNIGAVDSEGLEISLNTKAYTSDDFNLAFGTNFSYNKAIVDNLGDRTIIPSGESGISGTSVNLASNIVGYQPHSAQVFEQLYDANGQPIVGAYKDLNGDNQITLEDDRYIVNLRPNWTYGFNTNINYKNWNFAANFRGQIGGQIYNLKKEQNGTIQSAFPTNAQSLNNVLDFNSGAANPAFFNYTGNAQFSDYLLEDASFLRCDNVSLTYNIPDFVKDCNLQLTGAINNAFLITKYSGQDPENFNGVDKTFYPRPRTYTIGLLFDF
jgi:TonB-dependent starch-binding outer membrane protein SusC